MTIDRLTDAIGMIDDRFIAAAKNRSAHRHRHITRIAAVLAAILLIPAAVWGGVHALGHMHASSGGAAVYLGMVTNGGCIYRKGHDYYAYTPQSSSQRIITNAGDKVQIVGSSVYYSDRGGTSLYRFDTNTGKSRALYTVDGTESRLVFTVQLSGNVIVGVIDKEKEQQDEFLIDGDTGKVLRRLSYRVSIADAEDMGTTYFEIYRGKTNPLIVRRMPKSEGSKKYGIYVNGTEMLGNGIASYPFPSFWGGNLVFECYPTSRDETVDERYYFIVTAYGGFVEESVLAEEGTPEFSYVDIADNYWYIDEGELYILHGNGKGTATREHIQKDADIPLYFMSTDGHYVYSVDSPTANTQQCWVYTGGELHLIDDDITD